MITARNLAILLMHLMLFGTACFDKIKSFTTPEWFVKQFEKTFIAKLPGGAKAGYWMIAACETAVAIALIAAGIRMEFVTGAANPLFTAALTGALFIYGMLGFGLRLTYDFQGSANMFAYFGATLLSLYLIGR